MAKTHAPGPQSDAKIRRYLVHTREDLADELRERVIHTEKDDTAYEDVTGITHKHLIKVARKFCLGDAVDDILQVLAEDGGEKKIRVFFLANRRKFEELPESERADLEWFFAAMEVTDKLVWVGDS